MIGTAAVIDTCVTVSAHEPIHEFLLGRLVITTEHPASSYGQPVLVGASGRAYGPADLPEWAVVGALDVLYDANDPQPPFSMDLDSSFQDWIERRRARDIELFNLMAAAGYRLRGS